MSYVRYRILAGEGETGLDRRKTLACRCRAETQNDIAASQGIGEEIVIAGQRRIGVSGRRSWRRLVLRIAHRLRRRHPVGFDKQKVKNDRCGADGMQTVDQFGQPVPRPRPLTKFFKRALVDINNLDRRIQIGTRRGALQQVEGRLTRLTDCEGIRDPEHDQSADAGQEREHDRQMIEDRSAQP